LIFHFLDRAISADILKDSLVFSIMVVQPSYILLLAPHLEELHGLQSLLEQMRYAVEIAYSADQAIAKVRQSPPCLVILQEHPYLHTLIHQLRAIADAERITLVVVTECNSPSWFYQEQNPGIDGFLVKPLSPEVLSSLIQSASARQYCLSF
jgi:DNA-binding NarL/FixJ family response regulator